MTTYYHVAPAHYQQGNDLLSYNDYCERYGEEPGPWKFEDDRIDPDIVCLFESIDDAREFVDLFLPDGIILAIDPDPEYADPLSLSRNEEGYLYAYRIPAAHIIGPIQ